MAQRVASLYAEIGADTRGLRRGLDETKGALNKAQRNLTHFTTGAVAGFAAITGAVIAAKKAIDFAKEGAELEFMRGKFDRLAMSVDTTSEALVKDLRNATRGTLSDAKLMASATDFMSLGLAKTRDEVVRLTRVAGALGMDMNQLVLTLTNQTTMRFDQLGVAVDGFDERVKKLKETGMDANAAFTEAFLQQAEDQIKKVGDIADTNAGKIMQLEATLANLGDTAKLAAAPALGALAVELNRVLQESMAFDQAIANESTTLQQARDAVLKYSGSWEEYRQAILDMVPTDTMRQELLRNERFELESNTTALFYFTEELYRSAKASQEFKARFDAEIPLAAELGIQLTEAARKTQFFYSTMAAGRKPVMFFNEAIQENIKLGQEVAEAAAKAKSGYEKFLSILDAKVESPIASFIQDLKWWQAGGYEINLAFQKLQEIAADPELMAKPGALDAVLAAAEDLYIASQDVNQELGNIDTKDAATNIMNNLGMSLKESKEEITGTDGLEAALERVSSTMYQVNIDVVYREVNRPDTLDGGVTVTPSDPNKTRRRQHGGPVRAGAAYLVGEQGPEIFMPSTSGHVIPNNQATGGGSPIGGITNNIFASPGMDEYTLANYAALVMSQRARRSAIAGAGYVGQ